MKLIVASLLAGSAVAFVPSSPVARGFALRDAEVADPVVEEAEEATPAPTFAKQGKVKPATPFANELGAQMPVRKLC